MGAGFCFLMSQGAVQRAPLGLLSLLQAEYLISALASYEAKLRMKTAVEFLLTHPEIILENVHISWHENPEFRQLLEFTELP